MERLTGDKLESSHIVKKVVSTICKIVSVKWKGQMEEECLVSDLGMQRKLLHKQMFVAEWDDAGGWCWR
jgi:hypothetical protein